MKFNFLLGLLSFGLMTSYAYDLPTSGNTSLTTCSEMIYDQGGASGIVDDETTGSVTIYPGTSGTKVGIRILELDIDWYNDYLSIYNGTSASGTPLLRIQGARNANQLAEIGEFYATTSSGALTIQLETGKWSDGDGFKIETFCIESGYTMSTNTSRTLQTCDSYVYDNGGASGKYALNSSDTLFILPSEPGKLIKLDVENRHLNDGDAMYGQDGLLFLGGVLPTAFDNNEITLSLYGYSFDLNTYYSRRYAGGPWDGIEDGGVRFIHNSNDTLNANGYRLKVSCIDAPSVNFPLMVPKQGNTVINSCDTTFYDNGGYGGNYQASSSGSITFSPDDASKLVQVNFSEFGMSTGDEVIVFDGENTEATLLGSFSGASLPGTLESSVEGGSITVQLVSNASLENTGFKATASCDAPVADVPVIPVPYDDEIEVVTCDAIITDHALDGDYLSNADGAIVLVPEEGRGPIELTFTEFYMESNYDQLRVYDGANSFNTNLGSFSGNNIPEYVVATNSAGKMLVEFKSDGSGNYAGFTAHVGCDDEGDGPEDLLLTMPWVGKKEVSSCDTTIFDNGGIGDYTSSANGEFVITPSEPNKNITLDVIDFEGEYDNDDDVLVIYSGEDNSGEVLATLFGYYSPKGIDLPLLESKEGGVYLSFTADNASTGRGFEIKVGCVDRPVLDGVVLPESGTMSITTCDTTIYDDGGEENYTSEVTSSLVIYPAVADQAIELVVEEFEMESGYDFLEIYTGDTQNELLDVLDGSITSKPTYVSYDDNGAMLIREITDDIIHYSGFKITASCVDKPAPNYVVIPNTGMLTISTCDTVVYDDGGKGEYLNNTNGKLLVQPSLAGMDVVVTVLSMDLEQGIDTLVFYEGDGTQQLIRSYYGTEGAGDWFRSTAADGSLLMKQYSNDNTVAEGFKLEVGCKEKQPEGVLRMPVFGIESYTTCDTMIYDNGGIDDYSNSTEASIVLTPAETEKVIQLEIVSFVMEDDYDFLYVYSGESTEDSLLVSWTGTVNGGVNSLADNGALLLTQFTDNSVFYNGFQIHATCIDRPKATNLPAEDSLVVSSCDTSFYDDGGKLGEYSNNSDLLVTFLPEGEEKFVKLSFEELYVEESYDSIYVYKGKEVLEENLLDELTGEYLDALVYTDSSITIHFVTDNNVTESGFKISVSCSSVITSLVEEESLVEFFPNPTTDIVTISGIEVDTWEVHTVVGTVVLMGTGNQVDLSVLPSGNYIIKTGELSLKVFKI